MGEGKAHRKKKSGRKAEKRKHAVDSKKGQSQPDGGSTGRMVDKEAQRKANPKAFVFSSRGKAKIQKARSAEKDQRRMHVPAVERAVEEPPPFTVLVHGPPGVGKTTLLRCLIKHYTRQDVREIKGPITVVAGKSRRLTFLECPQDMASMLDAAKVADLVLLLIDGAFGFEMETFEFLNLLQVHGFPKVMGVLTHLDGFKDNKALKKTKKALKHRFWTEIYQGAKLFYLSGIRNGKYLKREVHNLARFISVMKFRPLTWRQTHPYLLADRFEDVTPGEALRANPKCDRDITVYGYVRGTNWRQNLVSHIAGVGDFRVNEISAMPDPCPLPGQAKKRSLNERERLIYAPMSDVGGLLFDKDAMYVEIPDWKVQYSASGTVGVHEIDGGENLVRSLQATQIGIDEKLDKSRIQLFAGGAKLTGDEANQILDKSTPGDGIVNGKMMNGHRMDESESESESNSDEEEEEDDDDEEDSEGEDDHQGKHHGGPTDQEVVWASDGRMRRRANFKTQDIKGNEFNQLDEKNVDASDSFDSDSSAEDIDSDSESEGLGSAARWKNAMLERAAILFSTRAADLQDYIYGKRSLNSEEAIIRNRGAKKLMTEGVDSDDSDELFQPKARRNNRSKSENEHFEDHNSLDTSKLKMDIDILNHWEAPGAPEELRNRFVTGDWQAGEARSLARPDHDTNDESLEDSEDEIYGDFEDLETGKVFSGSDDPATRAAALAIKAADAEEASIATKKAAKKAAFDSEYDQAGSGKGVKDGMDGDITKPSESKIDEDEPETYYDAIKREMAERVQRTKAAMDALDSEQRIAMEGHRPGNYVRLKFSGIPCEMVDNFDPRRPLLIGGLGRSEEKTGYMQFRLKRHRWFPKVLKNRDPLIFSIGWRRFQSLPVFAIKDNNERLRMLKYSPEHMHCLAAVWGPLSPPGSGILALQKLDAQVSHWRVAATGVVLQLDASLHIVKKLKLVGNPFKIHKHTAFINGMFNSQLEAAKFEGASVRTVSGIRGTIKKSLRAGSSGGAKDGSFRATFEDKPLLSDIVFLRAWVQVDIPKFSVMVTNLLAPMPGAPQRLPKPRRNRVVEEDAKEDTSTMDNTVEKNLQAAHLDRHFIASNRFTGPRPGYIFTLGSRGIGYYEDIARKQKLKLDSKANGSVEQPDEYRHTNDSSKSLDPQIPGSDGWIGLRSIAELRREAGIGAPRRGDSLYHEIERRPRVFNPLHVPKNLQAALPFKSKPKLEMKRHRKTLEQRRAVVVEPEERKRMSLVAQLNAIRNAKAEARRAQRARHAEKMAKKTAEEEAWRAKYNKEQRKKRIIEQSMSEKRQSKRSKYDD